MKLVWDESAWDDYVWWQTPRWGVTDDLQNTAGAAT